MRKENVFAESGLEPSAQLAWVLGVLCGGGSVRQGTISLSAYEPFFLSIFSQRFTSLFDLKPHHYQSLDQSSLKQRQTVAFNSRRLANELGDLKNGSWPFTLHARHSWLEDRESYVKAFLSGYFDRNGIVSDPLTGDHYQALLHLSHWAAFEYLRVLLHILDVREVSPKKPRTQADDIVALMVRGLFRVHSFAEAVTSVVPNKELTLSQYRGLPPAFLIPDQQLLNTYDQALQLHEELGLGSHRLHQHFSENGIRVSVAQLDDWLCGRKNPHHWWKIYPSRINSQTLESLNHFSDQAQVTTFLTRFRNEKDAAQAHAVIYDAMVNISHTVEILPCVIASLRKKYGDDLDWKSIEIGHRRILRWIPKLRNSQTVTELKTNIKSFVGMYDRYIDLIVHPDLSGLL